MFKNVYKKWRISITQFLTISDQTKAFSFFCKNCGFSSEVEDLYDVMSIRERCFKSATENKIHIELRKHSDCVTQKCTHCISFHDKYISLNLGFNRLMPELF